MERHPHDAGMVRTLDLFQRHVAGGAVRLGNQAGHDNDLGVDLHALDRHAVAHLALQRAYLIEDVDHLPAGVGTPQHIVLTEVAMRRQNQQTRDHRNAREKSFQCVGRRCLQDIDQQAHGLAHPCRRGTPARLEAQPAECGRQIGPRRIGVARFELLQSLAQGGTQHRHIADVRREHQPLAIDRVHAQEIQHAAVAYLWPGEHRARQMPVEVQHTLPDRACFLQSRHMTAKRFEIDLQHALAVVRRFHEQFLGSKELAHRHAFRYQMFLVHAQVVPAPRFFTQGEIGPGMLKHTFLEMAHTVLQRRAVERAGGFRRHGSEHTAQVTLQQQHTILGETATQKCIHRIAVIHHPAFQCIDHATSRSKIGAGFQATP